MMPPPAIPASLLLFVAVLTVITPNELHTEGLSGTAFPLHDGRWLDLACRFWNMNAACGGRAREPENGI